MSDLVPYLGMVICLLVGLMFGSWFEQLAQKRERSKAEWAQVWAEIERIKREHPNP